MSGAIQAASFQFVTKNKWPLVFALAALLVTVAGFTAIQDAHAQFGPLNKLADPNKTTEFHCNSGMLPPGNGTFGGSSAPCIDPVIPHSCMQQHPSS
jgi:ammonium transporter, Amt family